jgi:hypothetical protein
VFFRNIGVGLVPVACELVNVCKQSGLRANKIASDKFVTYFFAIGTFTDIVTRITIRLAYDTSIRKGNLDAP